MSSENFVDSMLPLVLFTFAVLVEASYSASNIRSNTSYSPYLAFVIH